MKQLCLICFVLTIGLKLSAQQLETDSARISKIAVKDADKKFRATSAMRKAFRQKKLYNTSDYFKPTLKTTKDAGLLNDSNYVKTYRHIAYDDTVNQIRLNRSKIVIIGVVVAGVVVVGIILVKLVEAFANGVAHLFDRVI